MQTFLGFWGKLPAPPVRGRAGSTLSSFVRIRCRGRQGLAVICTRLNALIVWLTNRFPSSLSTKKRSVCIGPETLRFFCPRNTGETDIETKKKAKAGYSILGALIVLPHTRKNATPRGERRDTGETTTQKLERSRAEQRTQNNAPQNERHATNHYTL